MSETIDTTGITGNGNVADTARLIQQFGMPTVILAVFLVIFVGTLAVVRIDFIRQDSERTDSHERTVKHLADTFSKHFDDSRSDAKEERAFNRQNQERMHLEMHDLVEQAKTSNDMFRKTFEDVKKH